MTNDKIFLFPNLHILPVMTIARNTAPDTASYLLTQFSLSHDIYSPVGIIIFPIISFVGMHAF